jgi:MFS family permease
LSAFTAITAGIGPVMGGWLVEHISWRAIFFINVPLAFAVGCRANRNLKPPDIKVYTFLCQ